MFYTKVNKLAAPVGYNFNCTNIFLGNSEALSPCHCSIGKILVLRNHKAMCAFFVHQVRLVGLPDFATVQPIAHFCSAQWPTFYIQVEIFSGP